MKSLMWFLASLIVVALVAVSLALYGTNPSAGPKPESTTTTTTVVDIPAANPSYPCDTADRLRLTGSRAEARKEYESVLRRAHSNYACVLTGLAELSRLETTTTTLAPVPVGKGAGQGLRKLVGNGRFGRLRLGATEWLIVVIMVAILVRLGALARARRSRDPGPVEVAVFTNATGDKSLEPEGMAWLIRERLARADLKPTLLPGDAGGDEILDVVTENPLAAAAPVAKVFTYLRTLTKVSRGYRVTGGFLRRTETPSCGVSIQIVNISTGQVKVSALWATGYEEAAIEAAYLAASVVYRDVKTVYPWERWTSEDGRSLRLYHELKQYAASTDADAHDRAFALAYEAIACDPGNALLRLERAKLSEVVEGFFDSLDVYLTIVARWPDFHMARYRLAAVLSFVDEWVKEWEASRSPGHGRHSQHKRILWQLGELGEPAGDVQRGQLVKDLDHYDTQRFKAAILRLSNDQRRRIENDPKVGKGSLGSLAVTARLIGELQLCKLKMEQSPATDMTREIERLETELRAELGKKRAGWQAHYNAACFYAHRTEMKDGGERGARHRALEELNVVVDKGALMTPAEQTWLREKDPDLRPLRNTEAYRRWALRAFGYPTPPELPVEAVEVVNQRAVWKALASARLERWEGWFQRLAESGAPQASTLHDLETSCRREEELWRAVQVLCADPGDEAARDRLAKSDGKPPDIPSLWRKVICLDATALRTELRSNETYLAALREISGLQGQVWEQRARDARDAALGLLPPPSGPRSRAWAMDGERTWFAVSAVVGAVRTATPPDDEAVTDALQALRQVSENLGS